MSLREVFKKQGWQKVCPLDTSDMPSEDGDADDGNEDDGDDEDDDDPAG